MCCISGLGDIVMPGLLLCFVLRYDAYKKATLVCQMGQVPGPRSMVCFLFMKLLLGSLVLALNSRGQTCV